MITARTRAELAFDAILDRFPDLRLRRQINAQTLRRIVGWGKGCCTVCGVTTAGARRQWCGVECVTEFKRRCQPTTATWEVQLRDKGVCARCRIDTRMFADLPGYFRSLHSWRSLFDKLRQAGSLEAARKNPCRCFGCQTAREADLIATWECDHIVPVSEGGGLCGPAGLRTLCRGCHLIESANLARRRAQRRKTA
jgi:hypothetical protein